MATPKTLKVHVFKSLPSMWYNDKLHETFIVTNTTRNYYKYQGNRIIFKEDAIILEK
jgi:hypothetical protein